MAIIGLKKINLIIFNAGIFAMKYLKTCVSFVDISVKNATILMQSSEIFEYCNRKRVIRLLGRVFLNLV